MEIIQLNDRLRLIAIMGKYLILLFVVLYGVVPSVGNCKNNSMPSNETIMEWWSEDSVNWEDLEYINTRSSRKIFLRNRETAFLFEVSIGPRGRNSTSSVIMVRPEKKQAREVTAFPGHVEIQGVFKHIRHVYDLDHDGISEVELSNFVSGQGYGESSYSIVQFDNWTPVILHKTDFSENSGCCGSEKGSCGECHYEDVSWKFVDLNGDGVDDLVEEITTKQGQSEDRLTTTKKNNYYLFKNKKFIKVEDASKLHLP